MKYLFILMVMIGLHACTINRQDTTEIYGASIGIVNHTNNYIYATQVAGSGGGHAGRFHAGIANVCCVTLPVNWRPGLKVNVQWDMPDGTKHIWKQKVVEIEKYETPGSVYLHFFPNDEVRIVVTGWAGGAPEHPIPPPVKPSH